MELNKYITLKTIIGTVSGAIIGFGYYYFIGCKSGSCPITGNPYISTIYGAVAGMFLMFPVNKKNEKENGSGN